jgi:hypothetical protein
MAQYSEADKQRQAQSHETNKPELSDADFTRKLRELFDDTYLDVPSFAELVGYGRDTVASWLGDPTYSEWFFKADLPSPGERARIITRLANRAAMARRLVRRIRKSLNWLRDHRFSYAWIWKHFDCEGLRVELSATDWELYQQRNTALNALERLRCKVKPEQREHRFSLQSLREINAMLSGYINRNEDLPGFSPAKPDALCKAKGWSLAELARQSAACVDKACSIDLYPEDGIYPFRHADAFKVPPITAQYLSEVMSAARKTINPEIWRVVLHYSQEVAGQAAAETGTRFGLEQSSAGCSYGSPSRPGTLAGGLEKATAWATNVSRDKTLEGADEAAQESAALPQEQAGSNTAPSGSDSPGRQRRRRFKAPVTREALGSSIRDYLQKLDDTELLDRARAGDEEAGRLLRRAAKVLRRYRMGELTVDEAIQKLWPMRFITREHLNKWGFQGILADLLPCAESTVSISRTLVAIHDEVRSDGARRYSEDAQNHDGFRQDDRQSVSAGVMGRQPV